VTYFSLLLPLRWTIEERLPIFGILTAKGDSMQRAVIVLGGAFMGLMLLANASMARSDPAKAKKFQASLVTAYNACSAPNDTTAGGLPLPACHPAVPSDDTCTIDSKGGGKVAAKADPAGDIAVKVKLKGIGGCDGETLQGLASTRVTTNNCSSADPNGCTIVDLTDFNITATSACVIDKGKCQIKTTVNANYPLAITAGKSTSFTINGVALNRTTGPGTKGHVAAAGVSVP
jgi:hypothetical protein